MSSHIGFVLRRRSGRKPSMAARRSFEAVVDDRADLTGSESDCVETVGVTQAESQRAADSERERPLASVDAAAASPPALHCRRGAWCAARCATTMPRVCTVPLIVRQCKKRERMGASGARGRPGAQATPRAGRHHAACLAPDACLFRRRKKVKCACRVWHPKAPALTRRASRSASRARKRPGGTSRQ